jgi:two-component system sensor histidine kinase PilS (NtrC family)
LSWEFTSRIIALVHMKPTGELQFWLPWVIKIRFVIITFVFAIEYSIRQLLPRASTGNFIESLGFTIILWYVLGLFYLIYNQLSRDYSLQAYLQIFGDIFLITLIVHLTGDLESNYLSLYLVVVILASILLPRARAYWVAAISFVFMGATLEFDYLPDLFPTFAMNHPTLARYASSGRIPVDIGTLEVKIVASLLGFFAVAYLTSSLAERLRKTGEALRDKTGEVRSLQAINQNIIQSMRGGLITTDLTGSIIEINPAGAGILGQPREAVKGKSLNTFFPGLQDGHESFEEEPAAFSRREIHYHHPAGGERILGLSLSPLHEPEAGVVGNIYTFQDLTEEKRREAEYQAKDRMATLGRMAAGIAHEIRNPLTSIAGSIRMLQHISSLTEDQAKLIDIVNRESSRLDKLVSEFLNYSREQRYEFRTVDVVNLLDETLLLLEQHPRFHAGFEIQRNFPQRPVDIIADADKLRQVFWNICDNSLKAMPEGGRLTAEIQNGSGNEVQVSLADSGIGFSEEQLERIFEPFHPKFRNGTGLGLAIVYQIIQGHRGRIQMQSKQGEGSRFVIRLPRRQGLVGAP